VNGFTDDAFVGASRSHAFGPDGATATSPRAVGNTHMAA
jgi:hypothetical protein